MLTHDDDDYDDGKSFIVFLAPSLSNKTFRVLCAAELERKREEQNGACSGRSEEESISLDFSGREKNLIKIEQREEPSFLVFGAGSIN
jgi:hypothetical protein